MMGVTEKICRAVYADKKLCAGLRAISIFVTLASVSAFAYLAFVFFEISPLSLVRFLLIAGIPFVLVTLLRRIVGAPRPYEVYSFYGTPPKNKAGDSFPSRHAFSAFLIGTVLAFVSPVFGAILIALGVLLSVARVLLGIHFVKDVLVGALIGVASALLGMLILSPL